MQNDRDRQTDRPTDRRGGGLGWVVVARGEEMATKKALEYPVNFQNKTFIKKVKQRTQAAQSTWLGPPISSNMGGTERFLQ